MKGFGTVAGPGDFDGDCNLSLGGFGIGAEKTLFAEAIVGAEKTLDELEAAGAGAEKTLDE